VDNGEAFASEMTAKLTQLTLNIDSFRNTLENLTESQFYATRVNAFAPVLRRVGVYAVNFRALWKGEEVRWR
jgi:hypothetical protein